jgi:hypothetical protein
LTELSRAEIDVGRLADATTADESAVELAEQLGDSRLLAANHSALVAVHMASERHHARVPLPMRTRRR